MPPRTNTVEDLSRRVFDMARVACVLGDYIDGNSFMGGRCDSIGGKYLHRLH